MLPVNTLLQGRYLIVQQIGRGGMGAVYKATDTRLRSVVALKEMLVEGPALLKAFEREAQLLASLRHPALPRVSDHFVENNGQFLVMEFIPGDDLAGMLAQQGSPFATSVVLRWGDQLLDALDYLHTRQPPVVHRDIKPQNIKLTDRDEVILLDFGLAKGTALQTRATTGNSSIFGYTPHYAPLEQIQGTGTDPRSDLYSLAATMHHLLTGQPPVDALTRAAARVNEAPDPLVPANQLNPDVPVAVASVLARAMMQGPAQRYPSAIAMRTALREAMTGQLPPLVSYASQPTQIDLPMVMLAESEAQQAARPISQPMPTPVVSSSTTVQLPVMGTTMAQSAPSLPLAPPAQRPFFKQPWFFTLIAVVAVLLVGVGFFFARIAGNTASAEQPSSNALLVQSETKVTDEAPTVLAPNATQIQQTVQAELTAILEQQTAEAYKRATDIAMARDLANATDSVGTQTAIALTPTATPANEEPSDTVLPTVAATPVATLAATAQPKPTTAKLPTAAPAPTTAASATPQPTDTPAPSGSVVSTGSGSMFRGTANLGSIPADQGNGGACIQGHVTKTDGSLFNSFGVQVDLRGNTRQAATNAATGTYNMCGLGAGEWGVSIFSADGVNIPGSEQIAHQVRVKLSGQPGEIFYINFKALPGLIVPTDVPTLVVSPYDGIWRGSNSGTTTTGDYPPGRFELEVRNGMIYRISVDGPSCPFETYPRGVDIAGNSFQVSGAVYNPITGENASIQINVRGTFTSASSASGQMSAQMDGASCANATWKAAK